MTQGERSGGALDPESRAWVQDLRGDGPVHEDAVRRLHELLLRVARAEVRRRAPGLPIAGPELEDIAHQAAGDAAVAVIAKLDRFRGESRFTTWACKFAILEVSAKVGRHFWRQRTYALDVVDWSALPARFGFDPAREAEWSDLLGALRRAVQDDLTAHQRRIFLALVVQGVPLDALVLDLDSNRNAIYKTMFDARRKLRTVLVANGYLDPNNTARNA